jgi:hypothetical protein
MATYSERETELVKNLFAAGNACRTKPTLRQLRRLFLLSLRGHFAHPGNLAGGEVDPCLAYDPDAAENPLAIELMHTFDPKGSNKVPGLFVGLNVKRFEKVGMGNFAGTNADTSVVYRAMVAHGKLTVMSLARDEDQASALAEESVEFLFAWAPLIMSSTAIGLFDPEDVGDVTQVGKTPDRSYSVTAGFKLQWTLSSRISIESHRLKKIAFDLAGSSGPV